MNTSFISAAAGMVFGIGAVATGLVALDKHSETGFFRTERGAVGTGAMVAGGIGAFAALNHFVNIDGDAGAGVREFKYGALMGGSIAAMFGGFAFLNLD